MIGWSFKICGKWTVECEGLRDWGGGEGFHSPMGTYWVVTRGDGSRHVIQWGRMFAPSPVASEGATTHRLSLGAMADNE